MEKLGYSRQTQKLIYWILDDFANFWQGNNPGTRPSFIELAYTKEVMKAEFVKQKQANDFVKWLFEMAIYWEIPLRKEIRDLFSEDYHDTFIYTTLKKKICCICGKPGELQHFDRVGTSGYKSDTGLNYRVMCLCRKHHDEADNYISRMDFVKKYHLTGIYLNPEQVKELKGIYKGHFQAFKEE